MKVVTIYAHHNPRSFCHAVLDSFCAGLKQAGHSNEVIDLRAIGFDPEKSLIDAARNPIRRWLTKRWIGGRDARGIIRKIRATGGPRDVAAQQEEVARAEALAFISPVYFVGFPAILKGWIERVFTLGFAFKLRPEAWRGDISGRLPLLTHKKALIINTTIWDERSYDAGLRAAMKTLIDEYALIYPGVQSVEHVCFHAVHGADDAIRRGHLERAYGATACPQCPERHICGEGCA